MPTPSLNDGEDEGISTDNKHSNPSGSARAAPCAGRFLLTFLKAITYHLVTITYHLKPITYLLVA